MITDVQKSKINKLWEEFWTGGVANPLTVVEQITFLMFARMLDITESRNEKQAKRTGKNFKRIFPDNENGQALRWSHFKQLGADKMLPMVRDHVFPHFKTIAELETAEGAQKTTFQEYFKDAQLMIQKPNLLVSAVNMVDELPLEQGDVKGDLYEFLLSKLTTAGINGQFRTPRHIIELMIKIMDPKPTETVVDPACGTGGFLMETMRYLLKEYTEEDGTHKDELEDNKTHIQQHMFNGFDFDATMLRIASMNMLLHGVEAPNIHYQDTLSNSFPEKFPESATDAFDVVLANPPFKGSLDYEDVFPSLLRQVKTKKTELLFMVLILKMLKLGGRAAVIVPDGVLFGSSKAHQALRKLLVEDNQLEGVISLPSGVFKPYAGVSTAILIFTKGGTTDHVWFYDLQADGLSLDDKRAEIEENDIPDCFEKWQSRDKSIADTNNNDRTQKSFWVKKEELQKNKYDLSISSYKEVVEEEEEYDQPLEILGRLKALEKEILLDLDQLEGML